MHHKPEASKVKQPLLNAFSKITEISKSSKVDLSSGQGQN